MTMIRFDLDKLQTFLWYCYEKQWCLLELGQAHPQKFWFAENLGNIPENPRENGAQPYLISKHGAQGLQKITWRPFLEVTPKSLNHLRGRDFVGKSYTKNFSWKFGEIRAKILRHTKNSHAPKPMMKRHLRPPLVPLWKDRWVIATTMPPSSGVPVHINLHALSLFVVVGYNFSLYEHKLSAVSVDRVVHNCKNFRQGVKTGE